MITIALMMAAAVAAEGKCATFGCSMHKDPAHSCQCNLHCTAHKDCCSDYATACTANATDASSELHGSKGPRPSTNSTKRERSKPASPSPDGKHQHPTHDTANKTTTDHNAKHTPAANPAHGGESSSSSSSSQHSGSEKGSSKAAIGSSSKSSEHGKNEEHNKEKEAKEKAHEHEHKSGQKHRGAPSSVNIAIVVLACISGITVPITISIVLVLRARGICCVGTKFQRIDRPPVVPTESAIEAAPAASMVAASGAPLGA